MDSTQLWSLGGTGKDATLSLNKNANGYYFNFLGSSATAWDALGAGIDSAMLLGKKLAEQDAAKKYNAALETQANSSVAQLKSQAQSQITQSNQQQSYLRQQLGQVESSVQVVTGESGLTGASTARLKAEAGFNASQAQAVMSTNLGQSLATNLNQQIAVKNQANAQKKDTSFDWLSTALGVASIGASLFGGKK